MRALDISLKLYRKTLKRIQPAHIAMHRLMGGVILPGLERALDFKTIADDPFWFRLELLTGPHEIGDAARSRKAGGAGHDRAGYRRPRRLLQSAARAAGGRGWARHRA